MSLRRVTRPTTEAALRAELGRAQQMMRSRWDQIVKLRATLVVTEHRLRVAEAALDRLRTQHTGERPKGTRKQAGIVAGSASIAAANQS